MAEFEYSDTRTTDAQALWTYQYTGRTVIDALTALFSDESQRIETAARDVRDGYLLDSAVGVQLDALGAIVGQPREGRTDDVYRTWIKARIRVNRSSGSPPDLYAVAKLILGADSTLWLRQFPVGHVMQVSEDYFPSIDMESVQVLLQETSSAGVGLQLWYRGFAEETDAYTFQFAPGTSVVPSSNHGFNQGRLLTSLPQQESLDLSALLGTSLVELYDFASLDTAGDLDSIQGLVSEPSSTGTPPSVSLLASRDKHSTLTFDEPEGLTVSSSTDLFNVFEGSPAFSIAFIGSRRVTGATTRFLNTYGSGSGHQQILFVGTSDQWTLTLAGSSGTTLFTGPTVADTNVHRFVMVYDGAGNVDFYLDETKTSVSGTHSPVTGITEISIGSRADSVGGGRSWGTFYGQMPIIDRALTEDEAIEISRGLTRAYTDIYS